MKSGYRYLAASGAIVGIDAVVSGFAKAHPQIVMLVTVFLLLPFVMFFYLGVLELFWGWGNRMGGGPGRGEELVPVADVLVELAGNTHPRGPHRFEELQTRPQRKAA